ncbi:hypothetical protein A2774_01225 [Candidatus Roizmanbacteria bacterium RIFCSPHIGHO2_01_FULL_39_12c]|uniref:Uncharacterized protein n=1 Tax=Candidatus Roizmanbacteria bacterium RIFCSPHIGHO2_01_FULL_39_12c TaxID=1802031 RepID=A0A1F7G7X4_9BACT|nr:MAG: hypothetical protein A2774_01225 [Candidatus Roizmanbacteria bacterium RIFCSPHIGHO2_01_FULL_39_12c]OGK46450.1 MAG: hypothetical protein A2963_01630 [Candidatus Roizmanbacteria bacterium RIFCSPLOWO2_01_FULL_40_13]
MDKTYNDFRLIFQSIANIIESFACLVNLYLKYLIITIWVRLELYYSKNKNLYEKGVKLTKNPLLCSYLLLDIGYQINFIYSYPITNIYYRIS